MNSVFLKILMNCSQALYSTNKIQYWWYLPCDKQCNNISRKNSDTGFCRQSDNSPGVDTLIMAIIMISPFAALFLFSYFPLKTSLPVYTVILIIAGYCYYIMFRSMRDKARTGMEAMVGKEGTVTEDIEPEGKIEFKNEIWTTATGDGKIVRARKSRFLVQKGSF